MLTPEDIEIDREFHQDYVIMRALVRVPCALKLTGDEWRDGKKRERAKAQLRREALAWIYDGKAE